MKRFRKVVTTYDHDPLQGGELVPKVYHGAYVTLYGLSEFAVNLMYKYVRSKRIVEDTEFFAKKLSFWDKIELIARSQIGRRYLYHYSKPGSNQHLAYQTAIQVPDYFISYRGLQYYDPDDPADDYHDEANIYSNRLYRPLDEADKLDRLSRILGGSHRKPRKAKPLVVNVLSTLIRAAGLALPAEPPARTDEAEEVSEADRPPGYSLGPLPVLKLEPASPTPAGGSAIKAEAKTPAKDSAAKTPAGGSAIKAEAKTPARDAKTEATPTGATKAEAKTPVGDPAAKTGAKTPAGSSATKAEAKTPGRLGPGVPVITTIPEFRQTIDSLHNQTPEQLVDLAKTLGLRETRSDDDPNELYKKIINQYIANLDKSFKRANKDVINWVRDKATKTRYVPPTITPLRPKGKKK